MCSALNGIKISTDDRDPHTAHEHRISLLCQDVSICTVDVCIKTRGKTCQTMRMLVDTGSSQSWIVSDLCTMPVCKAAPRRLVVKREVNHTKTNGYREGSKADRKHTKNVRISYNTGFLIGNLVKVWFHTDFGIGSAQIIALVKPSTNLLSGVDSHKSRMPSMEF